MLVQISTGIGLLVLCVCVQVAGIIALVRFLPSIGRLFDAKLGKAVSLYSLVVSTVLILLIAHLTQILIWAAFFAGSTATPYFQSALYFAAVTYTTLGYGDLVPDQAQRMMAGLCAMTGLLSFGLSTAALVTMLRSLVEIED
ncbi:MAG: potassium channel family protein [Alphaproteobacteria bacterium]